MPEQLIASIKSHTDTVGAEAQRLRAPEMLSGFTKYDPDYWCLVAIGDSLVRVRLLLEQNFNFIETLGLLAVTRYLFEVGVWFHLFKLDARYGLVYYAELLETNRRYWKDYRSQLDREINLLNEFEQMESSAQASASDKFANLSEATQLADRLRAIGKIVDDEAARCFSMYTEQAKHNGYGFQAHLVRKQVVPQVDKKLNEVESEIADYDRRVRNTIQDIRPRRWQWKSMADRVELGGEYEFIYTFASKLLHATPASITTDQKNLELPEMMMFLKYINVKIFELIDIAHEYPQDA